MYTGRGEECPKQEVADDTKIMFQSMRGVFLIFLIFIFSSLLLATGQTLTRSWASKTPQLERQNSQDLSHAATDGGMPRVLLRDAADLKGVIGSLAPTAPQVDGVASATPRPQVH